VASALGTGGSGAFDLVAACAGFTYGVGIAADSVRGGSAKHVLVVGSEKFTDILDPYDRGTAFLFGDGAGAAVVGVAEQDGIGPVVWSSDGDQADVLRTESYPPLLRMEGRAVYRWATSSVPDMARRAVAAAGLELSDLAAFVPHQANLRITDSLVKSLKLPESVVVAATSSTAATPARPPCRSRCAGSSRRGRCAGATRCCCSASAPGSPRPARSSAARRPPAGPCSSPLVPAPTLRSSTMTVPASVKRSSPASPRSSRRSPAPRPTRSSPRRPSTRTSTSTA
jgi:hypothetical protein